MAKRLKKKKGSPGRRAVRTFYGAVVALSAVIVCAYVWWTLNVRPPEVPAPPVPSQSQVPPGGGAADPEGGGQAAPALERKDRFYTFLLAASDQSSGNADTIMVAAYDVPNQRLSLVSVPRDTLVDRTCNGKRYVKINGVYHAGVEELRGAVSDLLGIPIDFYLTVDLNAFTEVVDAVGGVDFQVPVHMSYDDPTQDLHIHYEPRMYQGLTGAQALEIVRCRKNTDGAERGMDRWMYDAYPDADIGRTRTQQQMLKAIAAKVLSWNSLPKVKAFLDIARRNVETDLAANDILYFAQSGLGADLETGLATATFTGAGDVTYRGVDWCYQYDRAAALEVINAMLNPYTTPVTADMVHMIQVR